MCSTCAFFRQRGSKMPPLLHKMYCFSKMKKTPTRPVHWYVHASPSSASHFLVFLASLLFYFRPPFPMEKAKKKKKNAIPNPDQMNSSKDRGEENEQNEICFTQINLINLTPSMSLFNTHRHRHGRNQQVNKQERKNYQFFFSSSFI